MVIALGVLGRNLFELRVIGLKPFKNTVLRDCPFKNKAKIHGIYGN